MPEGMLLAHGISIEDMVALVRAGFAIARGERVRTGDRVIEVGVRSITDAGRARVRAGPGERPQCH